MYFPKSEFMAKTCCRLSHLSVLCSDLVFCFQPCSLLSWVSEVSINANGIASSAIYLESHVQCGNYTLYFSQHDEQGNLIQSSTNQFAEVYYKSDYCSPQQ